MKTPALVALLLLSLPALAADFKYLGTLNASSGATTNNFDAASTKADGTSGAFTLTGSVAKPLRLYLQCTVAVRVKTGAGNTTAAANTGANKGVKIDTEQLFPFELTSTAVAIIPASGSGSAACDVFRRLE